MRHWLTTGCARSRVRSARVLHGDVVRWLSPLSASLRAVCPPVPAVDSEHTGVPSQHRYSTAPPSKAQQAVAMKVLITGGCGFIGQVLAREILQRGERAAALLNV